MIKVKMPRGTDFTLIGLSILITFFWSSAHIYAQQINPSFFKELRYRHIGPQGNRMIAAVGIPGDPDVYYAGAASGGIWKSIDGGVNWKPIFDDQPVSSIGSLAIAPSDTNIIWAGTGETFIRSNVSIGNGIYKSIDGGKSWKHMGLDRTGRIGRVVIHPQDPNIVFAAALGHCYGRQPERGVFRTRDGGETWEKVLFVDENTGCSDIAMDPNNPLILLAGMWQVEIKTWSRQSGGPGSGIYISKDGGNTWKRLKENGLPDSPVGKIAVAIAPNNSHRFYALLETEHGILWRSDNGGETWELINSSHIINERPHYYTRLVVAPDNYDEIYIPCVVFNVSFDGGKTFETKNWGFDHHDTWIDPKIPNRIFIADDGGLLISTNRGQSWKRKFLPVAQMYHVAVDNQTPYYVYGNRQDGVAFRGPSNSLMYFEDLGWKGISSCVWRMVAGEESGYAIPDPVDNNIVWGNGYDGALDRSDLRTNHKRSVRVWPESPMGYKADDLKYRFHWTFPISISPHNHNRIYAGSQYVHQTTDGGHSWKVISPDLSTNDRSKMQDSGGITIDNLGVEYGCTIFSIAESPLEEGLIWVGTTDGLMHVTRDGGLNWHNVTANIPNLPPWGTISNIEASKHKKAQCYITVDLHQMNDRNPYVYKTSDYGKTWKSISSDIPRSVFS
ncbi:MAG: sialidase, partial [Thermoplasmata archaeon]